MGAVTIVDGSRAVVHESRQKAVARVPSATVHVEQSHTFSGLPYDGTYEVTPTTSEQVLPTAHRTLADDVTVHQIPYLATSNDSGGITVSIAS